MDILFNPAVRIIVRLALGGILVYASWHKITDPPDFAKIIFNYKMFPASTINLLAIYVPWIELIAGFAIISGIGSRGASFLAGGMFIFFICALSYNLSRECPTICGCFSTFEDGKSLTPEQKFDEMRKEIWIDVGCLLLAAHVFFGSIVAARSVFADKEGAAGESSAAA
ncbi:MAG: MauE/DoxX family redox-associated membrane protein [Planctomycetota bacterium]